VKSLRVGLTPIFVSSSCYFRIEHAAAAARRREMSSAGWMAIRQSWPAAGPQGWTEFYPGEGNELAWLRTEFRTSSRVGGGADGVLGASRRGTRTCRAERIPCCPISACGVLHLEASASSSGRSPSPKHSPATYKPAGPVSSQGTSNSGWGGRVQGALPASMHAPAIRPHPVLHTTRLATGGDGQSGSSRPEI
jgi:hypothetical protein